MKTYLALISTLGMAMQLAITAAPEPEYKFPQFVRQSEVKIPQSFTPFGNRLEYNRFGDDGSSCLLDANGVLTWIDNQGTVRLLPDSGLAIPLFVTNTECLVWNNRFVDYATYNERPKAELKLFRAEPGSTDSTFTLVQVEGKEIVETPPITTSTGTLNFISTNRTDNGNERDAKPVNLYDLCDSRVYRLSFNGGVQLVTTLPVLVSGASNYADNVSPPETKSMGFGSDGATVVNFKKTWSLGTSAYVLDDDGDVYWIDSQGRSEKVVVEDGDGIVVRVLFASNTRMVYEYSTQTTRGIQEQRRSLSSGALLPSATKDITGVVGNTVDISNYSKNGDKRYFYTVDPADARIIRSYQLADGGIDPAFTRMATLPETVSVGAVTGTVNPNDGSTLIFGEDGSSLIWLNSSASGFNLIPSSSRASALYVTDSQAVVWENARAPLNGDGSIPPAIIKHYSRDTTTNVLTATKLIVDGKTLLNTTRSTPDFDYWLLTTAEKTQPSTTLLRTYRLASSLSIDSDDDGIPNAYETNTGIYVSRTDTGSDPSDPDSDNDGRSDGDEVFPFAVVDGSFTWSKAKVDAISKGGHLATIKNQIEYKGLQRQLRNKQIFTLWLGATDKASEGNFVWVTGETYDFNTAHDPSKADNWAPGQPDNLQDSDGVAMRADFRWADYAVSETRGYVLELPTSNPCKADTDGDGLNDNAEINTGSNPNKADTDGDSLNDKDEKNYGTNPLKKDTDGDTLTDSAEVRIHLTNPLLKDTDVDGLRDGDEVTLGTDPRIKDTDGDGLIDGDEISLGSNPLKKDTDGDGLSDGKEKNLGTNPVKKDTDGDGLSDFDENQAGSDPLDKSSPKNDDTDGDGLTDFEELFTYHTDPKVADTDGDGLRDGKEINLGTNPNKRDTDGDGLNDKGEVNAGTNPFKPDTDGDGLTDGQEVRLRTNPNRKDSDGEGLTDAQEVNGYHGFTSHPLLEDTDGDGYSDFVELNAQPPTDPRNYKVYPKSLSGLTAAATTTAYHNGVSPVSQKTISIDDGFTPFGQRPDITKNGEDGSVLIRDRNGVLTWVNKDGVALVLPDTSLAAPLIVTNNECVVWNNRYADYDNYAEKEQVEAVIFRRTANGSGILAPISLNLRGKQVIDTSEVSAATYGFVLSTTEVFDDGEESLRVVNTPAGEQEFPYDQWNGLRLRSYRIAWDGAVQRLTTYTTDVPKAQDDPVVDAVGFGSDGSVVFNMTEALTFRTPFETYTCTHLSTGDGTSHIVPNIDAITSAVYVSNSRLVLADELGALGDYSLSGEDLTLEKTMYPLGRVLPIHSYTKVGSPILVYTETSQNKLRLYEVRANLKDRGIVSLPVTLPENPIYVRNPNDGALLMRDLNNVGIVWVSTTKQDGDIFLGTAALMPQSRLGTPMYVNSRESIIWANAYANVMTDGEIPPAELTHYYINANDLPQFKRLSPPIVGNYVLNAPSLTPSPNNPGWYIRTTEKISSRSVKIRTYRMVEPDKIDSDSDGVPDVDEEDNGTDPLDTDSDDDGITDGQEVIDGTNPLKKDTDGDGLADNTEKNLGTNPVKIDTDGDGLTDGEEVKIYKTDPLRKDTDGDGYSDFEEVRDKTDPLVKDSDGDGLSDTEEQALGTNPNKKDTDGDGLNDGDEIVFKSDPLKFDTDGDGLSDSREKALGTNPNKKDTDGDGLTDKEEVNLGTNPSKADTDGDGVNDYDEIYLTGTDPTKPSFGDGSGSSDIPYGNSAVNGDYEGLVFDPTKGYAFKQTLRLASDGSFSSKLSGLRKDTSFRGKFSAKGSFTGDPGDAEGVTKVQLHVVKTGNTSYYILGSYDTRTGGKLYFQLRPYAYSSTKSYQGAQKVTFEASLAGDSSGPSGSTIATGKISSEGKVSFSIYLPDGNRASFSGPILDGNIIALYARSDASSHPVLIGALKLQSIQGVSDFSGPVRLFCASGGTGTLFPSGYDQERNLIGSNYYTPAVGTMPLSSFDVSANNAVFNWKGGNFGGVQKVGTWATDGKISVPYTQKDDTNVSFNSDTGLMKVDYVRTDSSRDLIDAPSEAFAVVLQKNKTVKGFYTSDASAAKFVVTPNDGGLEPDITSVSPRSKFVPAAETTYTVTVQTEGTWAVVIPSDLSWITARVSSENGDTGSSKITKGNGNGRVTITVARNLTNTRREGVIEIAGLKHTVTQEFR